MNDMKSKGYFTPVRIVFWTVMLGTLAWVAFLWVNSSIRSSHRYDKAGCIMQQRNLQQAVRSYANMNSTMNPGEPLDWTKIIGPGLFVEKTPVCPVHGTSAYEYSKVVPPIGTLVAPCKDPAHKPSSTEGW